MRTTIILVNQIEVVDFLASIDLDAELLRTAILFGEARRDSCTPNHPSIYPPISSWADCTRKLRDDLPRNIWTKTDHPIPGIINASKQILLAVSSGDENTGIADAIPKTNRSMGNAIIQAIYRNRLGILNLKFSEPDQTKDWGLPLIWFLLRRRRENRIFAELSMPDAIGRDNRVIGWAKRVILEPMDLDPTPHPVRDDEPQDFDPEVRRKAN
jgi:hypothetical protein